MVESLQRLVPPRRLGKFQLMARRGEGGMATVYVAAVGEGSLARLAAVKLLRQGAPDHDFRTRFLDEAKVVVRLHHNNIVDVREAGEVTGQLYIAMELIEGRDLADVWDRCAEVGRAFPVALAVHIVREVLRGLHYAHTFPGLGLVHRDVSPSNILIDWAGAVRLADFGLATSAMKASLTVPGMVFGKVGYMAPEQATRSPLDGRADVYGCGVVLWELLTGRPLRDSETDTQAVAGWDAVPPSSLSNRVDDELDDIVMTALQRSRDERYQSAGDFMEALSIWLSEHAPETTQERMAEFMNRLFGEARDRDHESYSSLIDDLEAMAAATPSTSSDDASHMFADGPADPHRGTAPRGAAARPVPTDGETIALGTIIAQRYRVAEPLGRGGMGTVYLAEHVTVGRKVAIKVLTYEWSEHEVVARRFKEEARAASAAGHPNIIEVFDAGELPDRRLFIVMEFLTGRSLYEELVEVGPLEVLRACKIIRDVARAVRAAHGVGIIHRDLKPDNIMLVNRGEGEMVKVLDFGISASADRTPEEQRLTIPGHALGTPEYMAPEQSKGRPPTEQFDIYALGVMLYEALAGEPPFVSENVVEVLARKSTEAAPRLDMRRGGLPPPLVELVHACIEVDPQRRPPGAEAFLAVLEPIVAALEGMQAMDTSGSGRYGILRDGAAATALALPARRPPFGSPPYYDGGVPPPPAYDALDAGLARVHSRPHPNDSLLSTPVDVEYMRGGPSRKAWWVLASVGLVLLLLLTVGVWWQMLRERDATVDGPPGGSDVASADGGKADGGKADGGEAGAVKPPGSTGPGETGVPATTGTGDDAKAAVDQDDGDVVIDDGDDGEGDGGREANPLESAKCKRTRQAAQDAFKRRSWNELLGHVGSRTCWKGKYRGDFADMKIKALFETKQFAGCAKLAKAARSSEAKNTVKICQQRAAMGG